MKTLTYGTLPSKQEILDAVTAIPEEDGGPGVYEFQLAHKDAVMYEDLSLYDFDHDEFTPDQHTWKVGLRYSPSAMWQLLTALVSVHESDISAEAAEWAGNFVSSILTTLGFEWV